MFGSLLTTCVFGAVLGVVYATEVSVGLEAVNYSSNAVQYSLSEAPVEEGFCDTTKQLSGYFKIDGSKSKN